MKKVIILAGAAVLSLAAGAGGWLMFGPKTPGHDDQAQVSSLDPPSSANHGHAAAAKMDATGKPTEIVMVSVGEILVPVIRNNRTRMYLAMKVFVEVAPGTEDAAKKVMPKIRDSMLLALHAKVAEPKTDVDPLDIAEIRRSLLGAARRVLGDNVREVLVNDFMRQDT